MFKLSLQITTTKQIIYFNYKKVIEYSNISNVEKLVDKLTIKVGMLITSLTLKFVRNSISTS